MLRALHVVGLLILVACVGRSELLRVREPGTTPPDDTCDPGATGTRADFPVCSGSRCSYPKPVGIAVGDLDRDGATDVVLGIDQDGILSVLAGNGDGTLAAPVDYDLNWDGQAVALADFNEDSWLDVVAASWNSQVYVFRGLGDGTLAAGVGIGLSGTPVDVLARDLDRDGHVDLVSAHAFIDGSVEVALGNGDGTFAAAATVLLNDTENYYSLAVGDLNRDSYWDLVTTNSDDAVTVLLGDGTGTTFAATRLSLPGGPIGAQVADFNRDAIPDLVVALRDQGRVVVLLGDGSGTAFSTVIPLVTAEAPTWVTVGHLDGDALPDLVVTYTRAKLVSVFFGRGGDSFGPRQDLALDADDSMGESLCGLTKAAIADLDGVAPPEIVVTDTQAGLAAVFTLTVTRPCTAP